MAILIFKRFFTVRPVQLYRVFSLTWPASMQIYWNKRKRLHKKRVQLPEDWFGTPTRPPFHCFGTPIWPPWRQMKTLIGAKQSRSNKSLFSSVGNIKILRSWVACHLTYFVFHSWKCPSRRFFLACHTVFTMMCTMTISAADRHRVYILPVYVEHLLQAFLKKRVWNGLQK